MADGLNDARAMRVAEVMNDFRTLQLRISSLQATPAASEYSEAGYGILRQCHAEAQAVLSSHFDMGNTGTSSNAEQTKRSLQRILLDASARRFRAHRIYSRALAAMRWVQRRQQILGGRPPSPSHMNTLRQNDSILRSELAVLVDSKIYSELRANDQAAGNWMGEMAELNTLLAYIRTH